MSTLQPVLSDGQIAIWSGVMFGYFTCIGPALLKWAGKH